MSAPERMWLIPANSHDLCYGDEPDWSSDAYGDQVQDGSPGETEYVRADIHAAALAALDEAREALEECADSLEPEISAKYPEAGRKAYPSETRRFERDMSTPRKARAAIARIDALRGGAA